METGVIVGFIVDNDQFFVSPNLIVQTLKLFKAIIASFFQELGQLGQQKCPYCLT